MSVQQVKHVVSSQDIDRAGYDEIIRRGLKFIKEGIPTDLCKGKIVATLFFQPSTRTMNAFQTAMIRAGGGWIGVTGEDALSMAKGESFEDTIMTYSSFADCIALRHPDDDSAERAAKASFVPIMNCGSGSREHAVGVSMMLLTLAHYLQRPLEGAKIGIYGTPEINRATKALVPIFGMFGMELIIDDLGHFPLPQKVEDRAKANGLKSLRYDKLDNFIGDVDILMVTRGLQKGIFPEGKFPKEKEEMILQSFKPITTEHMKKMRPDAILSMILPRIFEIDLAVDSDPRAIYSKQEPFTESGLAVMTYLLGIEVA
jgi:aspartate carbamoyltransferase catalytic subunit